jgi:hypothetical protein
MFLGSYSFDGDPEILIPAYHRLVASLPEDAFELHVCVREESGITVLDTCPSQGIFEGFTSSSGFTEAVAAAGLPVPHMRPLGLVVQVLGKVLRS